MSETPGPACPPPAQRTPLTSRPQVPQGHVDGEVAQLADLSEEQGQPRAPQTPSTPSHIPLPAYHKDGQCQFNLLSSIG